MKQSHTVFFYHKLTPNSIHTPTVKTMLGDVW